jgi:hypothetical protein
MFTSSIFDGVDATKPSLLLTQATASTEASAKAVERSSAHTELAETAAISAGLSAVHEQLRQVKSKLLVPLQSLKSSDWRHSMQLRQQYLQQLKSSHAQLLQILEIERALASDSARI